jgi:transposase
MFGGIHDAVIHPGLLVESQTHHQVTVIGPVAQDHCWQTLTPDAFPLSRFVIDWQTKRVTCPQGHPSQKWSQTHDKHDNPIINIRFSPTACAACPVRQQCTHSQEAPRHLTLRPQPQHEALQTMRSFQTTPQFKSRYDILHITISQRYQKWDAPPPFWVLDYGSAQSYNIGYL